MPSITLSGADEKTSLDDLVRLADMGAEIGLLYTSSPDARNRYPSLSWISEAVEALGKRAAVHICGHRARTSFSEQRLNWLLKEVGRVHVNGLVTDKALAYILDIVMPRGGTIITQHNALNAANAAMPWRTDEVQHELLVDASGGAGISPERWDRPVTEKRVGFAGGLGPDNLAVELPKIEEAAQGKDFWIDMEGKLRDKDDFFSVEKALRVMELWTERIGS